MTDATLRRIAFGLGLAGGILILLGGLAMPMMGRMMAGGMGASAPMDGMPCCTGTGMDPVWAWGMAAVGIVTGGTVTVVAAMVASRPRTTALGVVLVVASAASFLSMGGFMIGGGLGIAAGILAIVAAEERPS